VIKTRIDAVGFLAQLKKEVVTDFEAESEPLIDIVDALLGYQLNSNPITLGTIEPDVSRSIKIDQDDLLGAFLRLHESVGGYIYVDQARALQWRLNIGESKGQQIRYKKNLKGITRHTDYVDYAHRIYAYGDGEGVDRVRLGNLVTTPQVIANLDDAGKYWNGSDWVFATSRNINVGYWSAVCFKEGSGMRFICPVPSGSTILEAYLVFTASVGLEMEELGVKTRIRGEDADNAAAFSDLADYDARVMTTALVTWDDVPLYENNQEFWSPDISTIIQEIIDRPGWAVYNALALYWQDHEGRSTVAELTQRNAYSYDTSHILAPKLYIFYTPPDPVDYIEDLTSKALYGESVRIFIDKSIIDEGTLAEFANLKLAEVKQPYISYMVDMVNLEAVGWTFEEIQLGNVIRIMDEELGIDVQTRIVKIIWDLSEPLNTKIEVANMSKDVIEQLGRDYRWREKFY
jgi:hypothetical protein